jgi:hypothetical protein
MGGKQDPQKRGNHNHSACCNETNRGGNNRSAHLRNGWIARFREPRRNRKEAHWLVQAASSHLHGLFWLREHRSFFVDEDVFWTNLLLVCAGIDSRDQLLLGRGLVTHKAALGAVDSG